MARLIGSVTCKELILAFPEKFGKHAKKFRKELCDVISKEGFGSYVEIKGKYEADYIPKYRSKQTLLKKAQCVTISERYKDDFEWIKVSLFDDGHIEIVHPEQTLSALDKSKIKTLIIPKDRYRAYVIRDRDQERDRMLKYHDQFRVRVLKNIVSK